MWSGYTDGFFSRLGHESRQNYNYEPTAGAGLQQFVGEIDAYDKTRGNRRKGTVDASMQAIIDWLPA